MSCLFALCIIESLTLMANFKYKLLSMTFGGKANDALPFSAIPPVGIVGLQIITRKQQDST